jgi:electron-transferring-flavoprotein dehydrogenase
LRAEGAFLTSIPKLAFPGGALIGCSAGFVNVPRIKGTHTAMKSGMLAAEAAFAAIVSDRRSDVLADYEPSVRNGWIGEELRKVKNAEPAVAKLGATIGTLVAGTDMWLRHLGIRLPLEMKHHPDHETLWRRDIAPPIDYPRPDGVISFDKLSSVFL